MRLRTAALRQLSRGALCPTSSRTASCLAARTAPSFALSHRGQLQPRRGYASVSAAECQFGQPVHETHPHILAAGELTPGISAQEYHQRRAKLAASLPENAIAILPSADLKYRSGAVFYEFHQESDFLYLTGFNEPEAVAVIQKIGKDDDYIFHLFLRPKDAAAEQWEGARSGEQAALDVFNADKSGDIKNISKLLSPLIAGASQVYAESSSTKSAFSKFFSAKNTTEDSFFGLIKDANVRPIRPILNDLRIFKSESEIENMRLAGKLSGRAYTNAMRQQWTKEKDLGAYLEYQFKAQGCDGSAYVPVIAGGINANSIHYVRNDDVLSENDLVLIDAGGEYGGYITDITRTWPISGKFSSPQKDLYEAILKVQRASVALCRENANLSLDQIHRLTEQGLREQLKEIGFDLRGNAMDVLFPHHVGHYVGLDVHDCPGFPRSGALKTGQCVTIEPGIYVPDDDRFPAHFRGIGIRIEDSVCVQKDTALVLTTEAVKEVTSASRASSLTTLHHPKLASYQPPHWHKQRLQFKGASKDSNLTPNPKMSESSLPVRSSPSQATPIPDDDHEADLPLTMTASVVLTSLPRDATAALKDAGAFDKPKVTVRFKAIGSAPVLKQPVCRINATQRFEAVVAYLRRVVKCGPQDSVFLYVNNTFAPSLDEIVGNLHRCFRNQTEDQLVVSYSMTPAFG
ncbi:hypothetical protein V493_02498 [Pseudogymnoascus sp. VKM F-4281 (FW-2241)]|nr:hypothetical protein V493_02498 [Pseudogymnoascus sp. VKM F-4281 (FW-2241)]